MPAYAIVALFVFSAALLCVFKWLRDLDCALDAAFKGDSHADLP